MRLESRLQSLAQAQAVLMIPEGVEETRAEQDVSVTLLTWPEG